MSVGGHGQDPVASVRRDTRPAIRDNASIASVLPHRPALAQDAQDSPANKDLDHGGIMNQTARYRIRLYVVGGTKAAEQAIRSLTRLTRLLCGRIQAEVVDVLLHPELVLDHRLRPTPVLVRESPEPRVVFQGEITDPEQIIRALGLEPRPATRAYSASTSLAEPVPDPVSSRTR